MFFPWLCDGGSPVRLALWKNCITRLRPVNIYQGFLVYYVLTHTGMPACV
jgi:hypothetical protein